MCATKKGQARSDVGTEAEAWSWGHRTVPRSRRRPNRALREENRSADTVSRRGGRRTGHSWWTEPSEKPEVNLGRRPSVPRGRESHGVRPHGGSPAAALGRSGLGAGAGQWSHCDHGRGQARGGTGRAVTKTVSGWKTVHITSRDYGSGGSRPPRALLREGDPGSEEALTR